MASITIGFSIPEEDEARLQHLVQRFGQGNRSAFLRVAMKHMEVLDRAERLDELSRFGAERLEARGILPDEIPALVKQVLSPPPAVLTPIAEGYGFGIPTISINGNPAKEWGV